MATFSYHLASVGPGMMARALVRGPSRRRVPGLIRSECLSGMRLGEPVFSPKRMQPSHLTMIAAWDGPAAIDDFLAGTPLGRAFAAGWHVRMELLRRWGRFGPFDAFAERAVDHDPEAPVVAVTLARMKPLQVPRFLRWGWPVETLIRDHPAATLATAGYRWPGTISTFSAWTSQRAMVEMVRGHSPMPRPGRHAEAMAERERRDFHFEFAALRFRPIAEHGTWQGRAGFLPAWPEAGP